MGLGFSNLGTSQFLLGKKNKAPEASKESLFNNNAKKAQLKRDRQNVMKNNNQRSRLIDNAMSKPSLSDSDYNGV